MNTDIIRKIASNQERITELMNELKKNNDVKECEDEPVKIIEYETKEFNYNEVLNEPVVNLNDYHDILPNIVFHINDNIESVLTEFSVVNMDLRFLTSCRRMFMNCHKLKRVNWINSITNPIDCGYMFHYINNIESIKVSGLSVTNAESMFYINTIDTNRIEIELEIDFTYCASFNSFMNCNCTFDIDFSRCKPSRIPTNVSLYCLQCRSIKGVDHLCSCLRYFSVQSNYVEELDFSGMNKIDVDNNGGYKSLGMHIRCPCLRVLKYPNVPLCNQTFDMCFEDYSKLTHIELPDIRNCTIIVVIQENAMIPDNSLYEFRKLLSKGNRFVIRKYNTSMPRTRFVNCYDKIYSTLNLQVVDDSFK